MRLLRRDLMQSRTPLLTAGPFPRVEWSVWVLVAQPNFVMQSVEVYTISASHRAYRMRYLPPTRTCWVTAIPASWHNWTDAQNINLHMHACATTNLGVHVGTGAACSSQMPGAASTGRNCELTYTSMHAGQLCCAQSRCDVCIHTRVVGAIPLRSEFRVMGDNLLSPVK